MGIIILIMIAVIVLGLPMSISNNNHKHNTSHCDGDCANCPPHYGYRYGRWYYGHGHRHGCQRGGNGGYTGKTLQD